MKYNRRHFEERSLTTESMLIPPYYEGNQPQQKKQGVGKKGKKKMAMTQHANTAIVLF